MSPKIVLCTLVLNEMEWLPKLYQQHKDWPGMVQWTFVESADAVYAQTNPHLVTKGLSTDGTSQYLRKLSVQDERITYIHHGYSIGPSPDQNKCQARNRYIEEAEKHSPDFLLVLDADEFYTYLDQARISTMMADFGSRHFRSFCFKHRHPWRPPYLQEEPLFNHQVTGGFWDIPHVRGWRWFPGMRYVRNHNTPESSTGTLLDRPIRRFDLQPNTPECVHMAFSSKVELRHAKHQYYEARGEGRIDKRGWYTVSRAMFETWTPEVVLPRNATITPYAGSVPECFLEEVDNTRVSNDCQATS